MSCFDYPVDSQTILLKKRALRKELLKRRKANLRRKLNHHEK